MRVAIITPGVSPVPATQGGAIENLTEDILRINEKENKLDITVFSVYEEGALREAQKYKNSHFSFVKYPFFIECIDKCIFYLAKHVLKKQKIASYRFICRRIYVILNYIFKVKSEDFDRIVLLSNPTLLYMLRFVKSERNGCKIVYYLHNEASTVYGNERFLFKIDCFLSISKFVENSFVSKYSQIAECKKVVVKNCVDCDCFDSINIDKVNRYKRDYGIKEDDFVILFTGRIVPEKGVMELIHAVKLLDSNIHYKILIVGGGFFASGITGAFQEKLKEEISSIKENVILTGYINYKDIPEIYKLASIAVLPSICNEGAGLTMLEASVSGIPLITTYSGGIQEYIPNDCAVFVNRGDSIVKEIADAITLLYKHPEMRDKMSLNGSRLKYEFNLKKYYNDFCDAIC